MGTFSGKQVSRRHCEFRQIVESNRLYWLLRDSGSSTKTFLNGSNIPPGQDIRKSYHEGSQHTVVD